MSGISVSRITGYVTALPTPFKECGAVDHAAFARLCELQINEGISTLVVGEAAGEATSLLADELADIVGCAAQVARGRVPVLAGAISNSTMKAVALAQRAEQAGADALVCVAPYYNKPTQEGVLQHFRKIAESTRLPIMLHDVPARTACPIADTTIARLLDIPQFVGLIDSTGDVSRPARLRPVTGSDFRLLSADDASALAFLAQGGDGCVSVASNIAPGLCRNMYLAYRHGQIARAQRLAQALAPLAAILSRIGNPDALKAALAETGLISAAVRLPLVASSDGSEIAAVLDRLRDGYSEYLITHSPATISLPAAAM